MTKTIQQIGPITLPRVHSPVGVPVRGSSKDPGLAMQMRFGVTKRVDAERIEELINNPLRGQYEDDGGVLEWVQTEGALTKYTGWWILVACELGYDEHHFHVTDQDRMYLPVNITGYFLGSQGRPVLAATHREVTDPFGLTGQPLLAPLYPSLRVEGSGTLVSRVGDGLTMDLRKSSAKRELLRVDAAKFDISKTQLRPRLVDPAGIVHYGPSRSTVADGVRLESPFVRITIGQSASNHWLLEGYIGGVWEQLCVVRIRRTSGSAAMVWTVVQQEFRDDEVSLLLVCDHDGSQMRVSIVQGERGVRFSPEQAMIFQLLSPAETSPGAATRTSNYIEDNSALGSGAKRFMAFTDTAGAEDASLWITTVNANDQGLLGFVPPTPGADDTAAEQGKQLLYSRDELLVLE